MRIQITEVTPQLAEEWFKTIDISRQRKFRVNHANKLALSIQRGEWRMNNDMIMLDANGQLINGQHRCAAIQKAGRTVNAVVAWDCTDDQIKVVDQGTLPRKSCDALHYEGFVSSGNVAAVINTVYRDIRGKQIPSASECIVYARDHRVKIMEALQFWRRAQTSRCPIEPSMVCAIWFIASDLDSNAADSFCTALADGVTQKGDAAWMLIKRFREDKEHKTKKVPRRVKVALIIKAFLYWRAGVSPRRLIWTGAKEEFPTLDWTIKGNWRPMIMKENDLFEEGEDSGEDSGDV